MWTAETLLEMAGLVRIGKAGALGIVRTRIAILAGRLVLQYRQKSLRQIAEPGKVRRI